MRQGDFSGLVNTASGWLPQSVVNQYQQIAPSAVAPAGDNAIYNIYKVTGNQFTQATLPTGQASFPPFPGNVIPQSMLDSAALKTLPYIAQPGPFFLNGNGYISDLWSAMLSQDETRYTVRIDHTISDNNRIYGRFTETPIVKIQTTPASSTNSFAIYSRGAQAMLADTHTFSPTLINDLRLNYTRGKFSETLAPEFDATTGQNLNTILGLPSLSEGGYPALQSLWPSQSRGGGSGGSSANSLGVANPVYFENDVEERYAITDIVYKNVGTMSLKFGVDLSHALQNVDPLYGTFGGIYSFALTQTDSTGSGSGTGGSAFASFMLGVPSGNVTMANAMVPYYYRWNSAAAFVQDDWKIRPNLTLNIGVRYSVQMPRTEKYNHQGVFRPDLAQSFPLAKPLTLADGETISSVLAPPFAFSGIDGNSPYLTPPQYRDFEPRFGFAWQPKYLQSHHLVIRGGYGLSHTPIGGFSQLPQPSFGTASTYASTVPSATAQPSYVMRLGENPPLPISETPSQAIYGTSGPPSNGMVYLNSLYYQGGLATAALPSTGGFAVSRDYHTPYVNNWNLTVSWQAGANTTVEAAYTGAMGIHLFMGLEDINPSSSGLVTAELAQNITPTTTISDPLGRLNPVTGKVLTVENGTLGSRYLGFADLYQWFDSSGNSIRHAGYVNVVHRVGGGLTFNANYTLSKSIDTASSGGADHNILSAVNGQVSGQVIFGGTRQNDRSVSTYDQRHVIHGSAIYDLPFGRGRRFLTHAWKPLEFVAGGWTTTGLVRMNSGFPYTVYLTDANQLGDAAYSARPNIVSGVPIVNPLWSHSCPISTACQPYLNPAAFERPPLGQLGSAPRTLDNARGPWQQSFDLSIQKNFKLGESGKRRLQLRVDALNALNHPIFTVYPNNYGGAQLMGAPSTATLTTAAYNTWAASNSQPLYGTTAGTAQYNQVVAMVNGQKNSAGVLPANFYTIPLAKNFFGLSANSFDITTLNGYKLYQLRTSYNAGFGDLYNSNTPRYIQLGLKLYF